MGSGDVQSQGVNEGTWQAGRAVELRAEEEGLLGQGCRKVKGSGGCTEVGSFLGVRERWL